MSLAPNQPSPHSAISDEVLMRQTAQGHQSAFAQLVERHAARAFRIASRVLGNAADAEEAVQDAFSRIWVHAQAWDADKAAFTTWMHRIIVNACYDAIRKHKNNTQRVPLELVETTLASEDASEEEKHAKAREEKQIHAAIAALPPNQRMAITLCYFEEMTNPQAANYMQLHLKALEGLLVRARRKLKEMLEKELHYGR